MLGGQTKSMITYRLSNRQAKELSNGKRLQIAIPDPGTSDLYEDEFDFARQSLPDIDPQWIQAATEELIEVSPPTGEGGQLAGLIGHILRDGDDTYTGLTWFVEVVIVALQSRKTPRGTYPVQWPAEYIVDEPGEPIGDWTEIVRQLLELLDGSEDRDRCSGNALAADLGVPLATVFRWLAKEARPPVEMIPRVAQWIKSRRPPA
jgi:hypothetical protein